MEPQLAAYVERGDLKLIHQHRIVLGANSQNAAEGVECAGDQNKYWTYRAKLFDSQRSAGKNTFSKEHLKQLAGEVGLNKEEFASCLDSGKHTAEVKKQDQQAASQGVTATPSFILNGQLLRGLVPAPTLAKMIDEELKK